MRRANAEAIIFSECTTVAGFKLILGLPGEGIEPAIGDVTFNLLIPRVGNKFIEPLVKRRQVRLGQARHFRFQFLNAHGGKLFQRISEIKRGVR